VQDYNSAINPVRGYHGTSGKLEYALALFLGIAIKIQLNNLLNTKSCNKTVCTLTLGTKRNHDRIPPGMAIPGCPSQNGSKTRRARRERGP